MSQTVGKPCGRESLALGSLRLIHASLVFRAIRNEACVDESWILLREAEICDREKQDVDVLCRSITRDPVVDGSFPHQSPRRLGQSQRRKPHLHKSISGICRQWAVLEPLKAATVSSNPHFHLPSTGNRCQRRRRASEVSDSATIPHKQAHHRKKLSAAGRQTL